MPHKQRTNRSIVIEQGLRLRIVLGKPPVGVDFGLQEGKGHDYKTVQKRRSKGKDLSFDCTVIVKDNGDDGLPYFLGPLTQGPATGRFLYIDIGKIAGQRDSCWERRIKVLLSGITWDMIQEVSADSKLVLEAHFPGTAKDGGPSCGTIRPLDGWKLVREPEEGSGTDIGRTSAADAAVLVGELHLRQGDYTKAIAAFTRAIENGPTADAYQGRAKAYRGLAEIDELKAREHATEAKPPIRKPAQSQIKLRSGR